MLCVIRGEHLEAVQGDFVHPDPMRTFDLDQVAFVYGSRYKGTVSEHTYHAENSSGSQCTAYQMSLIEQTYVAAPYVPIHFASRNRTVGNSQPLHVMPRRKIECLGDRRPPAMVERFALASYELNLMVA